MTHLPIRLRLTLAFAVVMAGVLAGMGLLVYERVGSALLTSVDQTLRAQVQESSARAHGERGLIDPDAAAGATLAQLVDAQGAVLRTTPADLEPLLTPAEAAGVVGGARLWRTFTLARPLGDWRLLAAPRGSGEAIVVARSLDPREETLHHLFRELLIAGSLALVLACVAGYGLAAAALRPVEDMRRRAAAVTATSRGTLPVPHGGDEISRLAVTLNDMLTRLHDALEHERRFVADASHELRTPLALLRTELELALRRPRPAAELEQALRSAAEEAERLSRLADDLLLIARAEQGALPLRCNTVAVDAIFARVVTRFRTRARSLDRPLRVDATAALADADPDRLEQAVGNLVENALAHGDGEVRLYARRSNGHVELHVADRGTGFQPSFVARAFDRFSRADESRTAGGSGLGLSIVALVAEAHGGRVQAGNRPDGGADVWLTVPGVADEPLPPGEA